MYAIVRHKAARNAWYWGVHLKRRGKLHRRRFYDGKHGGFATALAAAVAWRDERIGSIPALTMREFHKQRRSNNTSGVPGVHFLRPAKQPDGIWQAKIKLANGCFAHKSYSVRRLGPDEAFERAVGARDDLLKLVDDRPYVTHPTAKRLARQGRTKPLRRLRKPRPAVT